MRWRSAGACSVHGRPPWQLGQEPNEGEKAEKTGFEPDSCEQLKLSEALRLKDYQG